MYKEESLTTWHGPADWDAQPAASIADADRLCRKLADAINAQGYSMLFVTVQDDGKRLVPAFDGDVPDTGDLSRALAARGADAFTRKACEAAAPLWWRCGELPPHMTATAQAWAQEIPSPVPGTPGVAFPVAVDRGHSGFVVFWGDGMLLDEADLCEVHARSHALFADVARQRRQECAVARPMSKREIECLRLTANGLTSDEIATALGLSVHTANQYLTNSTHKLDAMNRIHAVAKALRSGIID